MGKCEQKRRGEKGRVYPVVTLVIREARKVQETAAESPEPAEGRRKQI